MGATVAIVLLPFVARWAALSSTVLWSIGVTLGMIVLVGGLFRVFGGVFVRGAVAGDVEEAIDQLVAAYPNGDSEILRQAATFALIHTNDTRGYLEGCG